MSKSVYKVPESLDRSYLDHEINLSGKAWQMQPKPMKVILFYAASALGLLWIAAKTPLASSGGMLFLVIAWWAVATFTMGKQSKTKEMAFQAVPATFSYAPKQARLVTTRSSSDPSAFYSLAPFDDIDEDGLIRFSDRTFGQAYLVVGSASVLLFEEDRKAILNRVDQFWRKVDTDSEMIWVTTKEPQRVYRQVAALSRLAEREPTGDPELRELMEERFDILRDWVGTRFQSIHQYLLIKADSVEALRTANNVLQSEIENSSLMIRQCTRLDRDDAIELFKTFYKVPERA